MAREHSQGQRQALVEASIDELARVGSEAFEIGKVCQRLNVSPSLVNHHFGGRSQLLLEAAVTAYERYVQQQVDAVSDSGDDPEQQLTAWVEAQVGWTNRNLGIAVVMNFPEIHMPAGVPLAVETRLRLERASADNLQTLAAIIDRAQRNARGTGLVDREYVAARPQLAAATAYVGWLVYGHALWRAGRHAPTADLPEVRKLEASVFAGVPQVALLVARALAGTAKGG